MRLARACGVVQQRERGRGRGNREGQVDIQAPAPGQILGQHAAQQQADGAAAAARDRAVDPERLAALAGDR
jgi:hypothetical protein